MLAPPLGRSTALVLALALLACNPEPGPGIDGGTRDDAGGADASSVDDGGPDPEDAFVPDAPAADSALAPDAFAGDAGPWFTGACEPTPGTEVFDGVAVYCAGTAELAVMAGIDEPHLAILADVQITGRDSAGCIAIDVAQLLAPDGSVLTDLGAGEGRLGNAAYGPPLLRAPIPSAVSALCSEGERFDRFLVHLEGRVDGGTFSVTCGSTDTPSTFWPPKTMVTCHDGLDRAPAGFSTVRMGGLLEGRIGIPHGPSGAVLTAAGETEILSLPYTMGFFGRMPATQRVGPTLERSDASELTAGAGFPYTQIVTATVGSTVDLGTCASGERALRLLRLGGTTVRGPFTTEASFPCP